MKLNLPKQGTEGSAHKTSPCPANFSVHELSGPEEKAKQCISKTLLHQLDKQYTSKNILIY